MVRPRLIVRAIVSLLVGIPFALLLVYFLYSEFNLGIGESATLVTVVVVVLFGILEITLEPVRKHRESTTGELMEGIFGPKSHVEQYDDTESFAEKIQTEADDAVNSVDRIHFHMHHVNRIEDSLSDPTVRHRILLIKPTRSNRGQTGDMTGFESVYNSNLDKNPSSDEFIQNFEFIHRCLDNDRWKNTEVRLYETTPWLRAAIIDESRAGFLVLPSLYDGSKAAKFWTEDPNVVDSLESIFDDIWNDPRTTPFEEWYDDGQKLDSIPP